MPTGIYERTEAEKDRLRESADRARKLRTKQTFEKIGRKNAISLIGNVPWNKGKTGLVKYTEDQKKKKSELAKKLGYGKWMSGRSGEKSNLWLGEKAGYGAKHEFIRKNLGSPKYCEHCKRSNLSHRSYHWANKDHKYSRKFSDWMRLCVSCHRKYDYKMKINKTP